MGYGDELMAIGDAWRVHQADPRRRRVAIGDGRRLRCDHPELRRGLDTFIASPEDLEARPDLPWVISYRGVRPYHDHDGMRAVLRQLEPLRSRLPGASAPGRIVGRLGRYMFRMDYRPTPAPIVLDEREQQLHASWRQRRFIIIEPNIKPAASAGKQWPVERYAEVASALSKVVEVWQVAGPNGGLALPGVPALPRTTFRDMLPIMKAAQLYIGAEGGLHHAAAAMHTRAVVIYGGYTPPEVTGYAGHVCLTGSATYACGVHVGECLHCADAMRSITPAEVVSHARRMLANLQLAPA
jgi:hypothetical protein